MRICGASAFGPSPNQALGTSSTAVPIRIGDPASGCAGNRIPGEVNLTSHLAVTFGANTVSLNVNSNGPGNNVIEANNIFHALGCTQQPAPRQRTASPTRPRPRPGCE